VINSKPWGIPNDFTNMSLSPKYFNGTPPKRRNKYDNPSSIATIRKTLNMLDFFVRVVNKMGGFWFGGDGFI